MNSHFRFNFGCILLFQDICQCSWWLIKIMAQSSYCSQSYQCVVFPSIVQEFILTHCSYSFFFPWELDTTSALELIINDIPGKCFLQKGWAEQEIGHLGFCFVLAWFSCSVGLNKAFQHSPFQTRPKLTNQVRSQQCEMLIYFDRCFCCRSSLYLLCIEVSEV